MNFLETSSSEDDVIFIHLYTQVLITQMSYKLYSTEVLQVELQPTSCTVCTTSE